MGIQDGGEGRAAEVARDAVEAEEADALLEIEVHSVEVRHSSRTALPEWQRSGRNSAYGADSSGSASSTSLSQLSMSCRVDRTSPPTTWTPPLSAGLPWARMCTTAKPVPASGTDSTARSSAADPTVG
ncbi:hypothetical protein ACFXAE_15435 [Streptomyces sp. NPDC059454]|uniref:hypothetical protein n=1 Tax=Streptomyces sp. NPDC059454 TaxID=3346836 RepID=UPI0036856284